MMRLGDVPMSAGDRLFRYSPARAAALSLVAFAAAAAFLWLGLSRHSGLSTASSAAGSETRALARRRNFKNGVE